MEVHPRVNSLLAKRLWNALRVTFFMIRKGLVSKRKLIMDMNLMIKRGKLLRKSISNMLMSIHHHHHHYSSRSLARGSFGIQEYEFSCSNSPNPVFFRVPKRKHHYFPCINVPRAIEVEEEDEEDEIQLRNNYSSAANNAVVPKTPEYAFNFRFDASEFAPGEKRSPLLSPFSVRVSNYSSDEYDDDDDDKNNDGGNGQVDDEAEEFIRRFYEQLRVQSRARAIAAM